MKHTFIISDPLTRFRRWKFTNFDPEKGVPPLQQHFNHDFNFFFRENPNIYNADNIENWKRFYFTQNMVRNFKIFTVIKRKVLFRETYFHNF